MHEGHHGILDDEKDLDDIFGKKKKKDKDQGKSLGQKNDDKEKHNPSHDDKSCC
jgi:hypothetical protein